ncbi:MAG: sugar transferase, partial [Chloroflexi bacterium]|nr:sugar transferase [Chloroflexota bacterium]
VGPRALPIRMHLEDTQQEPRFPLRLQTRPGLTGLAQVYLPRQCPPRRRLAYDLLYVRKASLGLDLRLIFLSGWYTVAGRWGKGSRRPETRSWSALA